MSNRVNQAVELIYQMENDEVDQVVEAIKLKRTHLARQATGQLTVGDTVEFDARGRTVRGTVTKVNRKTVVVHERRPSDLVGTNWRVTASLLSRVEA
jgi:FKBP-type peptidyl-prolyl cis-trans isomerase 2